MQPLMRLSAPLVVCALLLGALLAIVGIPEIVLRGFLRHAQPWVLEIQFAALVVFTLRELPILLAGAGFNRHLAWRLAACAAGAAVLTAGVAPRTNRIYYDEHLYQESARNLTDLRRAQLCADGSVEYGRLQCSEAEYNKEPYAYPYLLSIVYRVSGVREGAAFAVNNAACFLFVLAVGLLTLRLSADWWCAVGASLLAALLPEHLLWSNTAAAEPTAALFAIVSVLAALHFCAARSAGALCWMVAATSFAMNFRLESPLVVGVVGLAVLLWAADELTRPRIWWAVAAGIAANAVLFVHLAAVRHEGWGTAGPRLSLGFVRDNLRANGWFYVGDERFPVVITILALVGAASFVRRRAVVLLLAYFAAFWGMFLVFYAGSYNYGADVRYSLLTDAPVCALGGFGWARVRQLVAKKTSPVRATWYAVAIPLVAFTWYLPVVRAVGEESWAARADVDFARAAARELPPHSFVLTQTPSLFLLWNIDSARMSFASDPTYLQRAANRYAGGVYLHAGFWCNVTDPVSVAVCDQTLDRTPHTLVRERRVRDYRYAMYRLDVRRTSTQPDKPPPDGRAIPGGQVDETRNPSARPTGREAPTTIRR